MGRALDLLDGVSRGAGMSHNPPFHSSKWFVVLLVLVALFLVGVWFALRHAESHRKAIDAVISHQLIEGNRVIQAHVTNGHYPNLETVRGLTNDPAFAKALSETSLLSAEDWRYNASQPAIDSAPTAGVLAARFGKRILVIHMDGQVSEVDESKLVGSGLVPLFSR